jgi:putative transposase
MANRYRLYPEPSQVPMLARHCADARFLWNLALEQANCYRPGCPTPGPAERSRQLAEARKATWLGEGSSSVQQQALRDFDQALRNWWAGTHRRPRWRKAGISEGFCVRDVRVERLNRRWVSLQVPKVGPVRFRLSRPLPAEHGMARVTADRAGRWHVSFAAPQPVLERSPTGRSVGVDAGVVATVTTSDGDMFHAPGLRPGETQRLRRLQRKLARQEKGSKRRAHTKAAVAKRKAREADRRRDFVEQTTTSLVRSFDVIVVEDLAVKHMVRSARGTVANPGVNAAVNILAAGLAVTARGGTSRSKGPDEARNRPVAA